MRISCHLLLERAGVQSLNGKKIFMEIVDVGRTSMDQNVLRAVSASEIETLGRIDLFI